MACYKYVAYGPHADDANAVTYTDTAVIPTSGTHKIRIQPIYGDDGTQLMYYEHTLTIDAVIYEKTAISAYTSDIESEVARLREILLTKGNMLQLYPSGLGNYSTINGPGAADAQDLTGGPYPQEVSVEPVGSNNAIAIHWVVVFRIAHCDSKLTELVQFNSELDFDVDEDGDIAFNLRVTYQRKTPITSIATLDTLVNALKHNAGTSFPGMKRRKRTSLSRDQRTAHIHIQYKEIKSDSAFYPIVRNIEAVDEISSDLVASGPLSGRGFSSWNRKITATITLPKRVHKSYAWIVFLKLMKQRLTYLQQLAKVANVLDVTPAPGQAGEASISKNSYLLTHISLTNPIYTRTMRFEAHYFIMCDLGNLLAKSKIFARVNTLFSDSPTDTVPVKLTDQWLAWDTANNDSLASALGLVHSVPIVYSQCAGTYSTPSVAATKLGAMETDQDSPNDVYEEPQSTEDAKHTWLEYKNGFSVVEETNNVQVSYLQPTPSPTYYQADPGTAGIYGARDANGFVINARYADASGTTLPSQTIRRGLSQFKVRMRGYAIRAKHKIPIPVVVSVGGQSAYRTGIIEYNQEQISQGEVPVYMATWDVVYNVDKDIHSQDLFNSIQSNGASGHFV
jgi:hypothetical protein